MMLRSKTMPARILIVDDDPRWLNFAREDLEVIFEVDMATNLETALVKLEKSHYDLIIASSRRLDVLEAISQLYPKRPVVVATGQPTTHEAIRSYRLGAMDYFAKDFQPEVVSGKAREAIKKSAKKSGLMGS
jgi:DNA-binding NtrC family response regulator